MSLPYIPWRGCPYPSCHGQWSRLPSTAFAVALVPNGQLVVGLYTVPTDKAGAALTALRVVRNGGDMWDTDEIEQLLRA